MPVAPRPVWTDPSPHREAFVSFRGTRLYYLDWGGPAQAETLVFLAGAGHSAHIFDDIAPRFADCWRPLAITRRGVSPSVDSTNADWSVEAMMADVMAILDSLGRERVTLVGHSFAGAEITAIAKRYPERVARLVYLDATFEPPVADTRTDPVPRPMPGPSERTFSAYGTWLQRYFYGLWSNALEADMRATREIPGAEAFRPMRGVAPQEADFAAHPPSYADLMPPILAVITHRTVASSYPWLHPTADTVASAEASKYLAEVVRPASQLARDRLRREAPSATIIELEGPHHIFIAREDTVLSAIRAFLIR